MYNKDQLTDKELEKQEEAEAKNFFQEVANESINLLEGLHSFKVSLTISDEIIEKIQNNTNQYTLITDLIEKAVFYELDTYSEHLNGLSIEISTGISEIISLILLQKIYNISDNTIIFSLLKTMSYGVQWSDKNRISHIIYKLIEENHLEKTRNNIEMILKESTKEKKFERYQGCPMLDLWKENIKWVQTALQLIKSKVVFQVDPKILNNSW